MMALVGTPQTGKSRLLREIGAQVVLDARTLTPPPSRTEGPGTLIGIDDAHLAEPTLLFAWINTAMAGTASLILASTDRPTAWSATTGWHLPDLSSRLSAVPVVLLEAPDNDLLARALQEALRQAGVVASRSAIDGILPRLHRRFDAILDVAASAGRLALEIPPPKPLLRRAVDDNPQACRG